MRKSEFHQLQIVDHPLLAHKLRLLRREDTSVQEFRRLVEEVGYLLAVQATQKLPTAPVTVKTPLEDTTGEKIDVPILLVPILRAGLGLVPPFLKLMPFAQVAVMGARRDEETLRPELYYENLPADLGSHFVIVLDPMLATGGSLISVLTRLREKGARRIAAAVLIAAPEGVGALAKQFPDVPIFAGALDRKLNEKGYILPGLGDAGDRLFGS